MTKESYWACSLASGAAQAGEAAPSTQARPVKILRIGESPLDARAPVEGVRGQGFPLRHYGNQPFRGHDAAVWSRFRLFVFFSRGPPSSRAAAQEL
jgi:hypothetical protein